MGNDAIWRRFATDCDRVARREELEAAVGEALRAHGAEHWREQFAAAGIPAGEVKTLERVYASLQVRHQDLVLSVDHSTLGPIELPGVPLRFSLSRPVEAAAPPTLGQHSAEIRAELTADDVA